MLQIDSSTVAAAFGSKLVCDLLGPSSKQVGNALAKLTKAGVRNVERVLTKAVRRKRELGIKGGVVAPRVVPLLLQNAQWCDDELTAAYLGGVLCSARSPAGRDDRAVGHLRLIEGLSSYALRAHCIVYASVAKLPRLRLASIAQALASGLGVTILLDEEELRAKMAFLDGEDPEGLLNHAFVTLAAADLCAQGLRSVPLAKSKQLVRYMHLTPRGVELFCWGFGCGQAGVGAFFKGADWGQEAETLAVIPLEVRLGIVNFALA